MTEYVYNVANTQILNAIAEKLGMLTVVEDRATGQLIETIRTQGQLKSGEGSYYLNHVGVVEVPTGNVITVGDRTIEQRVALPGEWGRLRINGQSNILADLPQEVPIVVYTQYQQANNGTDEATPAIWSSDGGNTAAPSYIGSIGTIF